MQINLDNLSHACSQKQLFKYMHKKSINSSSILFLSFGKKSHFIKCKVMKPNFKK